jgi:hypothetical protein
MTNKQIAHEVRRRYLLKDAERMEKEAKARRGSAARLLKEAEELDLEALQNRSVAEGMAD